MGQLQVVSIGGGNPVFPRQHPQEAFEQQRFGFGVFLLSRKASAQ
jgi:hypothetical protein